MASPDRRPIYSDLAHQFLGHFPATLSGPRRVGREAEYPLVDRTGSAADVSRLWPLLLADGDLVPHYDAVNTDLIVALVGNQYGYALEVGRGTIEVTTGPCDHLLDLQANHDRALVRLLGAVQSIDCRLLGYGIQPLTPPSSSLLSPKQRYHALHQVLGDEWLWYTVSASDQLHIDVTAGESVALLNIALAVTPFIVSLCGNSPIHSGRNSDFCAAREGEVSRTADGARRHGIPQQPYRSLIDFIGQLASLPMLVRRSDEHLLPDGRLYADTLAETGSDFSAFLLHDHYVWQSARLRTAHGTLELRSACQQPPDDSMAACALYLALLEAAEPIRDYLRDVLGDAWWEQLRAYQMAAIRQGLAAPVPAPRILETVLQMGATALAVRGFGEERLLQPFYRRLDMQENPAQRARRVFREQGMVGMIDSVTITP